MGQKVHPIGFRLGITKDWKSKWFSHKEYAAHLHEDIRIRKRIKEKYGTNAGVSHIVIERRASTVKIYIHTARPGILIGPRGSNIEALKQDLQKLTGKEIILEIVEIKKPQLDAQLVAENTALQLERRVSYRRAMKRAVSDCFKFGGEGIKIMCSGRLAGAEIARREWYIEGRLPLNTLRANVDYGYAVARTKYGTIGVKVWIYKGQILEKGKLVL